MLDKLEKGIAFKVHQDKVEILARFTIRRGTLELIILILLAGLMVLASMNSEELHRWMLELFLGWLQILLSTKTDLP